jgi:hypothetical protein
MKREADKLVGTKVKARRAELEARLAAGLAPMEKAPVMYELRGLRLLERQQSVRQQVDRAQDEVMGMGERGYKKFARETDAARESADKQAIKRRVAEQEAHVKALMNIRTKMREMTAAARARKDDCNKRVRSRPSSPTPPESRFAVTWRRLLACIVSSTTVREPWVAE